MNLFLLCSLGLQTLSSSGPTQEPAVLVPESPIVVLKREALALEPLVASALAKDFLKATSNLSAIPSRTLYLDEAAKTYKTETAGAPLSKNEKSKLKRIDLDESFYWTTKYGSPLAYTRPLDVLGGYGLKNVSGLKILDFGYGTIGHLRLLAGLGANVTGIDVDPVLRALYSTPSDQGLVKNPEGRDGQVRLIDGRFPADSAVTAAVGGEYDLIISKNTLKKGYVHPERPVEQRRLLNLDVDDATFVKTLHRALKRGGRVLIYNLSPAPSPPGQPYKNWADGRCPFSKEVWEAAGFRVIAYDQDDSDAARAIGHALGWDQGSSPIDLKSDLFAKYSLMEKSRDGSAP
jgi:SAM-dependent methyltransferase